MKSIKIAMLAGLMLCGSGTLCQALIGYTALNYQFTPFEGQTTEFNGSSISIGVPTVNIPDIVLGFDIKDPNAVGGYVERFVGSAQLESYSIASASSAGWYGTFTIGYTDLQNDPETLTIVGDGATGSITDSDPHTANGRWTYGSGVPDQSDTILLLALATATLGGMRFLLQRQAQPVQRPI